MKKGIISIVTVALIVSSYGCVGEAKSESGEDSSTVSDNAQATTDEETDGIQFFTGTWDEALEKAKEENKLIFLDAYASWCGPCKRMSKSVFTDEKVGEFFNANFIIPLNQNLLLPSLNEIVVKVVSKTVIIID